MEAQRESRGGPSAYRRAQMYAALVQVALALISVAESFRFTYWDEVNGPGAGFIPRWLGIVWLPVALGLVWESRKLTDIQGGTEVLPRGEEARRFGWFVLMLISCLLLFAPVGALITVAGFVALALRLFERLSWRQAISIGSVMSVVIYLIFHTWLGVPLPKGLLFFL